MARQGPPWHAAAWSRPRPPPPTGPLVLPPRSRRAPVRSLRCPPSCVIADIAARVATRSAAPPSRAEVRRRCGALVIVLASRSCSALVDPAFAARRHPACSSCGLALAHRHVPQRGAGARARARGDAAAAVVRAAWQTPIRDFRANRRPILLLSVASCCSPRSSSRSCVPRPSLPICRSPPRSRWARSWRRRMPSRRPRSCASWPCRGASLTVLEARAWSTTRRP